MENGEFVDAAKISANGNEDESKNVTEMLESCLQIGNPMNKENSTGENVTAEEETSSYLEQLPPEMLAKICDKLDHDSLLAMAAQCRKFAKIAIPMVHERRKDIMAVLEPHLIEAKRYLEQQEYLLTRQLWTKEEQLNMMAMHLSKRRKKRANKKFIEKNKRQIYNNWMAPFSINYFETEDNYFEWELVANELVKIAHLHCDEFGLYYQSTLTRAIRSVEKNFEPTPPIFDPWLFYRPYYSERRLLSVETAEHLKKHVNYLLFKDFMHKFPMLSKITTIYWPDDADLMEEQLQKYAKHQKKSEEWNKKKQHNRGSTNHQTRQQKRKPSAIGRQRWKLKYQ